MPNNKKKRGKKSSPRAGRKHEASGSVDFSLLPSFPGPETLEQSLQRILGYDKISIGNELVEIEEIDNEYYIVIPSKHHGSTKDESSDENTKVIGTPLKDAIEILQIRPDYEDRDQAKYPVAEGIISRLLSSDSLAKRAMKRLVEVPDDDKDIYQMFMDRGEGIHIRCTIYDGHDLPADIEYQCEVRLVEDTEQKFTVFCKRSFLGGCLYNFSGKLAGYRQKYHNDLAVLLINECIVRAWNDAAEIVGEFDLDCISEALFSIFAERNRWNDIAMLRSYILNQHISKRKSLSKVSPAAYRLGVALEACGIFDKAAQIYGEAAKHMHKAKHPETHAMLLNAGLAWKRSGDYSTAESYYSMALHASLFQSDSIQYRSGVFQTLENLFILYSDPVKNYGPATVYVALRGLILNAGGELPERIKSDFNLFDLKECYRNATEDEMCRVVQSIVVNSTSVEAMRAAIMTISNPFNHVIGLPNPFAESNEACDYEDSAREFILKDKNVTTGYLDSCGSCGIVKEDKALKCCSSCNQVYYCSKTCQKDDWPHHKVACKATRKKKIDNDTKK